MVLSISVLGSFLYHRQYENKLIEVERPVLCHCFEYIIIHTFMLVKTIMSAVSER